MRHSQTVTDKKAYSVPELSRQYSISIGFLRSEIRRGAIRVRRLGRRVLVLREDWESYLTTTASDITLAGKK
jgi:hypothetical protein